MPDPTTPPIEFSPTRVIKADAEKEAKPLAGFDKGFFLRSEGGKFELKLTGRFQPFLNVQRKATVNPGDPDDTYINYLENFEVRRMRIVLEGHLAGKAVGYKLQTDFGKGVPSVKDAHFDIAVANDAWIRVGQWKRPFSRQQINSGGRFELTDRAITDKAFGAGRDVGVAIRNDYERSPDVEWTLGLFNGTGEAPVLSGTVTVDPMTGMGTIGTTAATNVPSKWKPALVGRIGINRHGLKGYSEADLEGGPLRYGVAFSGWLEGDFDDNNASNQKAELDYMVKADGFSTTGGFYAMTAQDPGPDTEVLDAELSLLGFHLQTGYMVTKSWQGSIRYAYTNDPRQKAKTSSDQQEISACANFFGRGRGHDEKLQAGFRFIKTGDLRFTDQIFFEIGANVGW